MTNRVTTTGIKGNTYETLFRRQIKRVKPPAVGMAVAYVSVYGFNIVNNILREGGVEEVRLVTDTKDGVTHPKALQRAVDSGWSVRVVDDLMGTFHPKSPPDPAKSRGRVHHRASTQTEHLSALVRSRELWSTT